MKLSKMIMTVLAMAAFAMVAAGGDDIRFEARLTGWAEGKAKFKVKPQDRVFQSEIEVEGEDLVPNTNYIVIIGADNVWHVRTDGFGSFEMEERSVGPDPLPITEGTPVVVNDTAGNTVLSGTFSKK